MKNKYKLIIFDLDGTLADTSIGILNSVRYAEQKLNLPQISLDKMYKFIGPPNHESYSKYFSLSGEELKQAIAYHKEYAVKKGYKELRFYDGIIDLLDKIHSANIQIAVATLKAHQTAVKIFKHFVITKKFDLIKGIDPHKPMTKADLLAECMKDLSCQKQETVLIGDSKYDAIGAEKAGIDFIGVTYGFGFKTPEDVDAYPNVGVANSVEEITNFVNEIVSKN